MKQSAIYLYSILKSVRKPRVSTAARGLPGAGEPRLVHGGRDLWLLVSTVPLSRYGEAAIERGLKDLDWVARCAMAHQAGMEDVSGASATIPMKLFTIFHDEKSALERAVGDRKRIRSVLDRIEGCEEWGLRVILDPAAARAGAEKAAGGPGGGSAAGGSAGGDGRSASGSAFLLRKKRLRDALRGMGARAAEGAERLFAALSRKAEEARRRPGAIREPAAAGILLEAAFLVKSRSSARFRAEARKLARSSRKSGCEVTLTGPWPPYSFVEEKR